MGRRLPSRSRILDLLDADARPWHVAEIAKALGADAADGDALERILDGMALDGLVVPRPGHHFRRATPATPATPATMAPVGEARPKRGLPTPDAREGTLNVHPKGFGFVATPGEDVFIPPDAMGNAMHGDRVSVRVRSRGPRGPEGELLGILERGTKRVAGVLRRRGRNAWLEPDDARVRGPIVLPSELDSRGSEGNSGEDGDAAIVVVTRWPEFPGENPEGRLEAVLGRPGELRVEIAKTLSMAQIQELHSPECVAEAEAYGPTVPEQLLAGREDLTHLPLPTIDPEDARDHDDAVWVQRADSGGYVAWIAIADVSAYVTPGTKLDAEALARGCSVYLPDRAIPMLPRALSSNLCSLLPDETRLCLGVEVQLDAGGRPTQSRVFRGVMRSRAKLTYGGVARALGLTEEPPREPKADAMVEDLRVALELSRLLRTQRMKRGALDFELPEPKVILGPGSTVVDVARRSADPGMKKAYQLIEELMLLANETVAAWLVERNVPTVFRVHEPPDPTKLVRLATLCETLGIDLDSEALQAPKELQALSKRLAKHPLSLILNMLLLRSMKQAYYDIRNLGHFGLASTAYLHFTSPIRRYPDLVVHRAVHAILDDRARVGSREGDVEKLADAAAAASSAERKAMEVERDVVDLHRAVLMRDRIGERCEGTVTAVVGSGVFVSLDAPFVDVLVKLEDMGLGGWAIDDDGLFAVAARSGERVGLGNRMMIEVLDVSIVRRAVLGRRVGGGPAFPSRREKYSKKKGKEAVRDRGGQGGRGGKGAKVRKSKKLGRRKKK